MSQSPKNLSLQLRLNRSLNRRRLGSARPATLDLAVLADEELLKVPLDALQAHETRLLLLHPLPHGLRAVAVDVSLAEHLVGDLVAEDAEVLDFLVGAGVLAAELVAGEGEDFEVFVGGFEVCGVRLLGVGCGLSGGDFMIAYPCREPQDRRAEE